MKSRSRRLACLLVLIATHLGGRAVTLNAEEISFKISSKPRHDGRIDPKLFGNFIELLDDLVPGMWAEMLNDRGFEGVTPAANWVYYDGSPDVLRSGLGQERGLVDREERGVQWVAMCAHLGPERSLERSDSIGPGGQDGRGYHVSMWVRGEGDVRVQAVLKTKKPAGGFEELAVIDLAKPSNEWTRVSGLLRSMGTTEQAIFEIRVQGEGTLWVDKASLMPEQNLQGWRSRRGAGDQGVATVGDSLGWERGRSRRLSLERGHWRSRPARSVPEHKLGADRLQRRGDRRILPVLRACEG